MSPTLAPQHDVSVINTATNTVVATIPIAGFVPPLNSSRSVPTAPAPMSPTLSPTMFPSSTPPPTRWSPPFPSEIQPTGVVVTPDGTRAYVTNVLNNTGFRHQHRHQYRRRHPPRRNPGPELLGICSNGNALLAAGLTFKANTSGALNCTLASGPTGSPGPVFTGGTMQFAGANIASALPIMPAGRGRHLRHQRQQCDALGRDQRARRPDQDRRRDADAAGSRHVYRRDVGQCRHAAGRCR